MIASDVIQRAKTYPSGPGREGKLAALAAYRQRLRDELGVLEVIRGQLEEHPGPEAWPEGIEDRILAALQRDREAA